MRYTPKKPKKKWAFRNNREAGAWHVKAIDGSNQCKNANRKRAGRPRMSRSEFREKLLEDLKHGD